MSKKSLRRVGTCLFFLGTFFGLAPAVALAQSYPNKPIKLVAPQAPGGATDTLSRIVAQKLSERLGQPVIVENRVGANGSVASGEVARLPADGYTLLMANDGTHAINPALYKSLRFDPLRDFTPIAIVGRVPFVLVTSAKSTFNSLEDVVAASRIRQVTFASAGNGSVNHLLGSMVQSRTGALMQHIPYRGAAPALVDVVGGQVDVMWASLASVVPFARSGQVKPLAVTTAKRSAVLPNVPSQAESRLLPGFDVGPWFGLVAPAGLPADVVQRLNTEVRQIVESPEVRKQLETAGAFPDPVTPEEFARIMRDDLNRWGKVVKESGATVD